MSQASDSLRQICLCYEESHRIPNHFTRLGGSYLRAGTSYTHSPSSLFLDRRPVSNRKLIPGRISDSMSLSATTRKHSCPGAEKIGRTGTAEVDTVVEVAAFARSFALGCVLGKYKVGLRSMLRRSARILRKRRSVHAQVGWRSRITGKSLERLRSLNGGFEIY